MCSRFHYRSCLGGVVSFLKAATSARAKGTSLSPQPCRKKDCGSGWVGGLGWYGLGGVGLGKLCLLRLLWCSCVAGKWREGVWIFSRTEATSGHDAGQSGPATRLEEPDSSSRAARKRCGRLRSLERFGDFAAKVMRASGLTCLGPEVGSVNPRQILETPRSAHTPTRR